MNLPLKSERIINSLAKQGLKVLPVHGIKETGECTCGKSDCPKPGKHPVQRDFAAKASADSDQIKTWFDENPDWNVGILLGAASGICDIEFDDAEGEETAEALLSEIKTPSYTSKRSVHRLFKLPENYQELKAAQTVNGLEIRIGSSAAYSVAPPSMHASGEMYEWIDTPDDFEFADFPESVLELLDQEKTAGESAKLDGSAGLTGKSEGYQLDALKGVKEGHRHFELAKAFGADLKKRGYSPELVASLFGAAARCDPPFPENEVVENILPISIKEQNNSQVKVRGLKEVVEKVWSQIDCGTSVPVYKCGEGEFEKFRISPETIIVIGGATGAGKTALATQLIFEAANTSPDLRILISNVELSPEVLMRRQIANWESIPFVSIQTGELTVGTKKSARQFLDEAENWNIDFDIGNRNITELRKQCEKNKPDIVLIDYLQRFQTDKKSGSAMDNVSYVMGELREIASLGVAVIAVSAISRTNGKKQDVSCFRDSSEIEFGANDAYVMNVGTGKIVTLKHVKARDRHMENINLEFHGKFQRFTSQEGGAK